MNPAREPDRDGKLAAAFGALMALVFVGAVSFVRYGV